MLKLIDKIIAVKEGRWHLLPDDYVKTSRGR
jgi:hypothetical protein